MTPLWITAVLVYMALGLLLFPLARLFPKHFGPAREVMLFLVGLAVVSCALPAWPTWGAALVLWTLWPVAVLIGFFISSVALDTGDKAVDPPPSLIGQHVKCLTDLKPSGKVEVDGRPRDATSIRDFIPKGSHVKIVRQQGFSLVVENPKMPR